MQCSREMKSQERIVNDEEVCRTPEARLMLAVLEEALATFRRGLRSLNPMERQDYRDVEKWLRIGDSNSPFAFENICWTLGIDPDYVRSGFYRLKCEAATGQKPRRIRTPRRESTYNRRIWRGRIGA